MPRRTLSASLLIVAGTLGSLVASASCTLTSPLSMLTDLTKPNETMSRLKPGYFTSRNAARTSVSERGIKAVQIYARWKASKDGLLKVTSDKRSLSPAGRGWGAREIFPARPTTKPLLANIIEFHQ